MSQRLAAVIALPVAMLFLFTPPASSQDETPTRVTVQNRTGDLPFSTSVGTDVEHVDVASGNLLVMIPFASVPGRGLNYSFGMRYDARFLVAGTRVITQNGQPYQIWNVENQIWFPDNTGLGWMVPQARTTWGTVKISCNTPNPNDQTTYRVDYIYQDADGSKHPLAYQWSAGGSCGGVWDISEPDLSGDGILAVSPGNNNYPYATFPDGVLSWFSGSATSWKDSNGNQKGEGAGALDTLGRAIVTQQNGTNQVLYKVYDTNGVLQTYTVNYTTINVHTNFNV